MFFLLDMKAYIKVTSSYLSKLNLCNGEPTDQEPVTTTLWLYYKSKKFLPNTGRNVQRVRSLEHRDFGTLMTV